MPISEGLQRQGYTSKINLEGETTFGQSKRRMMNANRYTNYKVPITKLKLSGKNVKFSVDTGSTINIIDETTFKQLQNIMARNDGHH